MIKSNLYLYNYFNLNNVFNCDWQKGFFSTGFEFYSNLLENYLRKFRNSFYFGYIYHSGFMF